MVREEAIIGGPILELLTTRGQQAGYSVAPQAEQTAQREGLRALGDALLGEGGEAFSPELLEGGEDANGVFFRIEGGGWRRRSASRLLSSMDHSTVSPRVKSMACATAEGKLMYHCSLDLRLMSWTLVGRPIDLSSHLTRYHKTSTLPTEIAKMFFYLVKGQSPGRPNSVRLQQAELRSAAHCTPKTKDGVA